MTNGQKAPHTEIWGARSETQSFYTQQTCLSWVNEEGSHLIPAGQESRP